MVPQVARTRYAASRDTLEEAMVVERVNRERIVLLGWSRAILMQLAHPLVAAGVVGHSTFRGGLADAAIRLHHTVGAMRSLTFGTPDERERALARIRAIHRTVNGVLAEDVGPFPAGTPYSAEDPALLLWVHATLVDSIADVYQRVVAPLTDDDLNALCEESAPLVAELGGNDSTTPRTWAALQRYLAAVLDSGTLAVAASTRALGAAVLEPRAAGLPLPLGATHRLVSVGLLDARLRDAYGFAWDVSSQHRFERTLAAIARARRLAPRVVAWWPEARRAERRGRPPVVSGSNSAGTAPTP